MTIGIQLRGGPCDGETHDGVRDTTRRITRSRTHPGVCYDISDEVDATNGRRIFVFRNGAPSSPPRRGR